MIPGQELDGLDCSSLTICFFFVLWPLLSSQSERDPPPAWREKKGVKPFRLLFWGGKVYPPLGPWGGYRYHTRMRGVSLESPTGAVRASLWISCLPCLQAGADLRFPRIRGGWLMWGFIPLTCTSTSTRRGRGETPSMASSQPSGNPCLVYSS